MTPEEQADLDDFQFDPDEIPVFGLVICGSVVVLSLVLLAPFALRWLLGQS